MLGCTLRAKSSNTRCWYCISVPNLAAWNRRSPSQTRAATWAGVVGRAARSIIKPFVEEGQVVGGQHDFLGVLDQPVVLGVEDVVYGGQADVLVGAAVAGDEMGVQQFVVVDRRVVARVEQADFDVAVGDAVRHRVMGDVGEEGGVDADRAWKRRPAQPRCRR